MLSPYSDTSARYSLVLQKGEPSEVRDNVKGIDTEGGACPDDDLGYLGVFDAGGLQLGSLQGNWIDHSGNVCHLSPAFLGSAKDFDFVAQGKRSGMNPKNPGGEPTGNGRGVVRFETNLSSFYRCAIPKKDSHALSRRGPACR
jgi:hypothetical protein